MKIRPGNIILTVVAVTAGVIVLLGYVWPQTAVPVPALEIIRQFILRLASILMAVAVCLGALNLIWIHIKKISNQSPGWLYSIFLILGLLGALAVGLAPPLLAVLGILPLPALPIEHAASGPANSLSLTMFKYVQAPLAAAISGLMLFFLVFAGYRLLRRRLSLTMGVFLVVAIISLLGMTPMLSALPDPEIFGIRTVWLWLAQVPAVAGARGLLLGVALGTIATGLRVLLILDRPYGD